MLDVGMKHVSSGAIEFTGSTAVPKSNFSQVVPLRVLPYQLGIVFAYIIDITTVTKDSINQMHTNIRSYTTRRAPKGYTKNPINVHAHTTGLNW